MIKPPPSCFYLLIHATFFKYKYRIKSGFDAIINSLITLNSQTYFQQLEYLSIRLI